MLESHPDASANMPSWHQRKGSPKPSGTLPISFLIWEKRLDQLDHYRVGRRSPDKTGYMTISNQSGNLESQARTRISKSSYLLQRILMKMRDHRRRIRCGNLSRFWTIWLWLPIQMISPRNFRSPWWLFMQQRDWSSQSFSDWMEENVFPLSRAAEDPMWVGGRTSSGIWGHAAHVLFLDQCQLTFALWI